MIVHSVRAHAWAPEEYEILRRVYPRHGADAVVAALLEAGYPHRSASSIKVRASDLGIRMLGRCYVCGAAFEYKNGRSPACPQCRCKAAKERDRERKRAMKLALQRGEPRPKRVRSEPEDDPELFARVEAAKRGLLDLQTLQILEAPRCE